MEKKQKQPRKNGRPSKYYTHIVPYMDKIRMWRQEGRPEEDIARTLKVAPSSWFLYKQKHEEFSEALKDEMDTIQAKTEKSLINTAWGWREPQVKETWERAPGMGDKMILVKKEVLPDKIIPPNVHAQKFILTNIAGHKWQDRRINETSITSNTEELKAIAEALDSIGKKGIDLTQFNEDPSMEFEDDDDNGVE